MYPTETLTLTAHTNREERIRRPSSRPLRAEHVAAGRHPLLDAVAALTSAGIWLQRLLSASGLPEEHESAAGEEPGGVPPEPKQAQEPPQPPAPEEEPKPAPAKPEKPPLSRFRRLWRATLITLVVIAAIFLAGVLTYHFTRYAPLNETLRQTQSELAKANQTLGEMEARLADAEKRAAALESDNQTLKSERDAARTHLELLRVLVEVDNARLALFQGDAEGAKAALTNTPDRLKTLGPKIAEFDAGLAQSMPQRLSLIISGLDRDVETAKIDLELFTKDLLGVEARLFGE